MKQYVQPNQYYVDRFDRGTIKELRALETFLPKGFNIESSYSSLQIFTLMGSESKGVSNFFSEDFQEQILGRMS